eukprot:UN19501
MYQKLLHNISTIQFEKNITALLP